jgi:hypothetical protein
MLAPQDSVDSMHHDQLSNQELQLTNVPGPRVQTKPFHQLAIDARNLVRRVPPQEAPEQERDLFASGGESGQIQRQPVESSQQVCAQWLALRALAGSLAGRDDTDIDIDGLGIP